MNDEIARWESATDIYRMPNCHHKDYLLQREKDATLQRRGKAINP